MQMITQLTLTGLLQFTAVQSVCQTFGRCSQSRMPLHALSMKPDDVTISSHDIWVTLASCPVISWVQSYVSGVSIVAYLAKDIDLVSNSGRSPIRFTSDITCICLGASCDWLHLRHTLTYSLT